MRLLIPKKFSKRRKNQRRAFLLLEVLIALALVALCAIPLLQPHFTIAKQERAFLIDAQLEFEAHSIYAEVLEDLFEHHFEWEAVNNGTVKPKVTKVSLEKKFTYPVEYKLATYDFHKKSHFDYRLLDIEIRFKAASQRESRDFNYRILTKRYRED